jgi:xylose isomerase
MNKYGYKFSFGPWNIHEGADPFGPEVRPSVAFDRKLELLKEMQFDAMQFHDDDAVPDLDQLTPAQIEQAAREVGKKLKDHGLVAEFVAPRLWFDPRTVDGGYTSNDPAHRQYAIERSYKCIDIAQAMGANLIVLWLAREGTYIRESKDPVRSTELLIEAVNKMLAHNSKIRIAIEPKPNEPMDHAYLPTIGHGLALGMRTNDPKRVGVLVETAHAILAGLDPSDEMGFALAFDKLYSVHLNDQNSLKFDQDKSFGSANLRRAFNQVLVLDAHRYHDKGMVGLDVKAMRTQKPETAHKHLRNSMATFLHLVEKARSLDRKRVADLVAARDYEELDALILSHLLGK